MLQQTWRRTEGLPASFGGRWRSLNCLSNRNAKLNDLFNDYDQHSFAIVTASIQPRNTAFQFNIINWFEGKEEKKSHDYQLMEILVDLRSIKSVSQFHSTWMQRME